MSIDKAAAEAVAEAQARVQLSNIDQGAEYAEALASVQRHLAEREAKAKRSAH